MILNGLGPKKRQNNINYDVSQNLDFVNSLEWPHIAINWGSDYTFDLQKSEVKMLSPIIRFSVEKVGPNSFWMWNAI